jgi:STAM-binding protein
VTEVYFFRRWIRINICMISSHLPNRRLKALSDTGISIEIDNNIPPRTYYRSGLEMVWMANVYLKEGSLENAYILYMKFMTW